MDILGHIRERLHNRKAGILDDMNALRAAILLPLIEKDGQLHVLFEVRSQQLKGQPGEICFPGGHIEGQDQYPCNTAIRETAEELGIQQDDITVLGPLDVLVTPFNMIIYSFVGRINNEAMLQPQEREVAELFCVPLDYLREAKPTISFTSLQITPIPSFPTHLLPNGKDYNWHRGRYPVYFYTYGKYIIWGITARILHHFLQIIM